MEQSPHVFLSREGADAFSRRAGPRAGAARLFRRPPSAAASSTSCAPGPSAEYFDIDLKYGTVGAVALDRDGHVAAATSTGGLTGKRWGRIGDSPIIGAGTYADDRACAVSATGAGEYFIRVGVAHEICARIAPCSAKAPTGRRADTVMAEVKALGGTGGVIVVTPGGDGVYSFNTPRHVSRRRLARRPIGRDLRRRGRRVHRAELAAVALLILLCCRSPAAGLVGIWP